MTVYLVGAGPGDPDLLTTKAARLLTEANVVVHDRLLDPRIFPLINPAAELIDVGKRPGGSNAQSEINELLVSYSLARPGAKIVRLKGGDPFVFGRGGEEAIALRDARIDYEVVPGVSSAFAAPAAAGIPVTHRSLSAGVVIVTGHRADNLCTNWQAIAQSGATVVVLMGIDQRENIASALMTGGLSGDTPIAMVERATWESQRSVRATLRELPTMDVQSPAVMIIGAVAALDLSDDALEAFIAQSA